MGKKLILSPNDDLLKINQPKVSGISGGCYCCGQQIHVSFKHLEVLPIGKIDNNYYYVFICDMCEEDATFLKNEKGVEEVSYDFLWIIQEELNAELSRLEKINGGFSDIERNDIIFRLYMTVKKKLVGKDTELSVIKKLTKK